MTGSARSAQGVSARDIALALGAMLALNFVGCACFGAAIWLPGNLGPDAKPKAKPSPGPIAPGPTGVSMSSPGLRYTFVLPNGFVPRVNSQYDDAILVPEPWLPSSVEIKLSTHDLTEDVSSMDAARLRQYARTALGAWTFGEPLETMMAADGSTALLYPEKDSADSLYTAVFHRRTAVLVYTNAGLQINDAQRKSLREATRTLVRGMKFR